MAKRPLDRSLFPSLFCFIFSYISFLLTSNYFFNLIFSLWSGLEKRSIKNKIPKLITLGPLTLRILKRQDFERKKENHQNTDPTKGKRMGTRQELKHKPQHSLSFSASKLLPLKWKISTTERKNISLERSWNILNGKMEIWTIKSQDNVWSPKNSFSLTPGLLSLSCKFLLR